MKIVYVNPSYTEGMGYIENCLPKAMAKRGHEVHLITSTGKAYFNYPMYKTTYEKFFGPPIEKAGKYTLQENVTHHRLNFSLIHNAFYFKGLGEVLDEIRPDIVHMWEVVSPYTIQFFLLKRKYKYVIYTSNHLLLSVIKIHNEWSSKLSPMRYLWILFKVVPGYLFRGYYKRCYAVTSDAKFIAEKYMGVPSEKCMITPLGTDTDIFKPEEDKNKTSQFRESLGFEKDDFIVLYTGRFTPAKNPLVVAKAIHDLQKKGYTRIKGLFVGSGEQKSEIAACVGCKIVDFVLYHQLPPYYQISDIGSWPMQESTSILDASATGLPVILNETMPAAEMFKSNGLFYKLGEQEDLASKILQLYSDEDLRLKLGKEGQRKMYEVYSWHKIAMERERDYIQDLRSN
jgi:glycosyltransferase involved in cell wall biosynthesis